MYNELLTLVFFLFGFVGFSFGLWFFYKLCRVVLLLVRYLEMKIKMLENIEKMEYGS